MQIGLKITELIRNPIGIIALFISMIYGFVNLLLRSTVEILFAYERLIILLFIVFFPCLILFVFYLLVTRHHGKLYAPSDYKDDKSFLNTLNDEEVEQKLQQEAAEEIQLTESPTESSSVVLNKVKSSLSGEGTKSFNEIKNEIKFIENSVISSYEKEFNLRAERNVGVSKTKVYFDALFYRENIATFIELKILKYPHTIRSVIHKVLYNIIIADKYLNSDVRLILVIVYSFDESELDRVKRLLNEEIQHCPVTVTLKFIPRNEIKI